jgi:hypothetical protein
MNPTTRLTILGFAATTMAACSSPSGDRSYGSSSMPSQAEQACLRAVTEMSNNPDVVLLDSYRSSDGTEVTVGVGPNRARWACTGYENGRTKDVYSMTN